MIRGILISVDYADLLEITLPVSASLLDEIVVVTAPHDTKTQEVCSRFANVKCYVTDAFYRYGAHFNKGLAMEEGFDVLGRSGWIVVLDADIVLPDTCFSEIEQAVRPGMLYGCPRLIWENPSRNIDHGWKRGRKTVDTEVCGYFQLFHAEDTRVANTRPWYDVTFSHAGGGDAYFQQLWKMNEKRFLPWYVLHLGPRDKNWFGRTTPEIGQTVPRFDETRNKRVKLQKQLRTFQGWDGQSPVRTHLDDRVEVPGYTSNFVWHRSKPK